MTLEERPRLNPLVWCTEIGRHFTWSSPPPSNITITITIIIKHQYDEQCGESIEQALMLLPRIKSRKVESQCRYGHAVFHLAHTHMGPCISPPTRTALRGLLSSIKAHSMVLRNTYSLPQPWSFHLLLAMLVFETIAALTHHSTFTPSPCTTSTLFVQSSTISLYYPPDEAISSLLPLSLPTNCHLSLSTMRPETAKKNNDSHYPPFSLASPHASCNRPRIYP